MILLNDVGVEVPTATQIFVHSQNRQHIFAITAATLSKLQLNILDARLHTTGDGCTFDVFYVLDDKDRPIGGNNALAAKIIKTLTEGILNPSAVKFDVQRRTPRQLKNFTLCTVATLRNEPESVGTILEVVTPDRPGLLAHLARIFTRFDLQLLNAKISTLGERVEDVFYLTDSDYQPITDPDLIELLQATICKELDERNQEDGAQSPSRKVKTWE